MDADTLAHLYRLIFRIRHVEEEVARIYPSDKIKSPIHLSIGQEAVSAGVCAALQPGDIFFGTYRSHGPYLAKGGDLKKMFAELYGKSTGCTKGKGGSMHLIDVAHGYMGSSAVVATTISHAVGYAYALRLRGSSAIVVSMFGDGASEEGAFHECMNLATLHSIPVLFICENNLYAVHTHIRLRQKLNSIFERVRPYGIQSERVENNDPIELYNLVKNATDEIRRTHIGPRFIEVMTYRWREHVGPGEDYDAGYRNRSEAEPWMKSDQLKRIGEMLDPKVRMRIEEEEKDAVREAIQFAEESPFPAPEELYTDMFKE